MLCACLAFTPSAHAQQNEKLQTLVYEVYAGGIHVLQATLTIDTTKKDHYDISLFAKTRGFWSSLIPWNGTFESHGWATKDGVFRPELHRSTTTWRDETDITSYNYNRDGSFKSLVKKDHGKAEIKEDVADELTQGTTDALTSTLNVLEKVAQGNPCAGEEEVFDGSRRFKQVFAPQKPEQLTPSKYNIYGGPSQVCTVEVIPVAGKWHEKPRGWMSIQEQGRERGTMPTVWMASMSKDLPAVPVKIRVKTAHGTLFMHLAEYQNGEKLLVAEKRVKE